MAEVGEQPDICLLVCWGRGWGWGLCLFSGRGERTLKVKVFLQGVCQDERVQVSPYAKKSRESIMAQTQAFSRKQAERGAGFGHHKATGASVVTTEGSQNELICRGQHTCSPLPSGLSPQVGYLSQERFISS